LLDVDGTVAAKNSLVLPSDKVPLHHWDNLTKETVPTFTSKGSPTTLSASFSPTVLAAFNSFTQHAEVRWFTDWFADAPMFFEEFGAMSFCVEGTDDFVDDITHEWWKLAFLRENHLDRKIIWIDDCLNTEAGVTRWIEEQNGRVQFLQPNARTGITSDDLTIINEMLLSMRSNKNR